MRRYLNDMPRTLLGSAYALFVVYLMLPLALMVAMSFKDSNFISFPITDWTLQWYIQVVQDKQFLDAVIYSVMIAVSTAVFATIVGVWLGLIIASNRVPFTAVIFALACLPAVVPGLVNAISMRIFIRLFDVAPGTFPIILAHTVHAVPFVVIMVLTRLRSMPVNLVDAARDLGADPMVAFMRVTVPYLMPALVGGMVFCVLTSIDDFVRTFFLGGYQTTLPMLLFARVQGGMSPEVNAMSTIILVVTAAVGLGAEFFTRRSRR